MAPITERTLIGLFMEVEHDLKEALDFRRHLASRLEAAIASSQPTEAHQNDYDQLAQEIDELRQERKSVIDLAHRHGFDPTPLLEQAVQALKNPPTQLRWADLEKLLV